MFPRANNHGKVAGPTAVLTDRVTTDFLQDPDAVIATIISDVEPDLTSVAMTSATA